MGQGYNMLGFVVIVILYAVIGLLAAAGAISTKLLKADAHTQDRDSLSAFWSDDGHPEVKTDGRGGATMTLLR